uniref:Uncharacterized protein n=1 Tax=Arundo donax TaxID=35708 RepID=A0A0A9BTE6_ARUDO
MKCSEIDGRCVQILFYDVYYFVTKNCLRPIVVRPKMGPRKKYNDPKNWLGQNCLTWTKPKTN